MGRGERRRERRRREMSFEREGARRGEERKAVGVGKKKGRGKIVR
jgi:hypothetical protein